MQPILILLALFPALASAGQWTVRATWDPVAAADGYRIQWWLDAGPKQIVSATQPPIEWQLPADAGGKRLAARIRSCAGGQCGAWSDTRTMTVVPPAPTGLRLELIWSTQP